MITRAQKLRLGVFLLITGGLLVVALIVLAGMSLLNPMDYYVIRTRESVNGLETGSPVKLNGVRVGRVDRLSLDDQSPEFIRLRLALRADTPVRRDTVAVINTTGITGLKYVELSLAPASSPPVRPGSEIPTGESTMQELTGRAQDVAVKAELLINNLLLLTREENRQKVESVIARADNILRLGEEKLAAGHVEELFADLGELSDGLKLSMARLDKLLLTAEKEVSATGSETRAAVSELRAVVTDANIVGTLNNVDQVLTSLDKRINDASLEQAINDLGATMEGVRRVVVQVEDMVAGRSNDLRSVLKNLREASDSLNSFSRSIKERPSLLLLGTSVSDERRAP